jgi:hypothetical protein
VREIATVLDDVEAHIRIDPREFLDPGAVIVTEFGQSFGQ